VKAKAQSKTSKAQNNISFDVSYAEIMAEVQKLQQMLDGNIEKKPRKKRVFKASEEAQIQPDYPMAKVKDDESEQESQSAKNRYKVSNLDEIREKISEVKDLIQEVAPNAEAEAAVLIEAENKVNEETSSKAEDQSATSQMDEAEVTTPDSAKNQEPKTEIFQATQEVIEANAEVNPKIESAPISGEEGEQVVGKSEIELDDKSDSKVTGEGETSNEPIVGKIESDDADEEPVVAKEAKPKAPRAKSATKAKAKSKATAKVDDTSNLDAYFLDNNPEADKEKGPVGLAAKRHAEELAKLDVKDESEIIKPNLAKHEKSGAEWGGTVNLEEDPDLEHPHS